MPVYAYGPGSPKLQGTVDNTDLFGIVGHALALSADPAVRAPKQSGRARGSTGPGPRQEERSETPISPDLHPWSSRHRNRLIRGGAHPWRFPWHRRGCAGCDGAAASGAVRVTSDVSDLLELQVLAGFFDQKGAFLGTGRFVHHLGADGHSHHGKPQLCETFTIKVPTALAHRAVSVAIGVPVLVNE